MPKTEGQDWNVYLWAIKARKNFPREWDQIIKDESSENGLEKFRDFSTVME